jgi:hypothetical protein
MSTDMRMSFSMMMRATWIVGALAACQPYTGIATGVLEADAMRLTPTDLRSRVYAAIDNMLSQNALLAATRGPLVVGSIADIQDVNRTTPLGNAIAELARSRLVQKQYNVTDLRLRSQVFLDRAQGELTLSRDRRAVLPSPSTAEIVSGTYAVGNGTVYVSLRVTAAIDAHIMAAGDFTLPRTADVDRLLSGYMVSMR